MNNPADNERAPEEAIDSDEAMASESTAQQAPEDDHEALRRLIEENEALKDKALRAAAEMENLRRRTARDVQDARAYAITNFARDMLGVADNLGRALEAIPAEAKESGEPVVTALIEGVEMTERGMLSALERHGVKKLDPHGEPFDPHFHQAMFEVPNPDIAANTVLNVVQAGYVIGDRVLRPAMVGVSKGGPKQPSGGRVAEAEGSSPEQAGEDAAAEPGPPNPFMEKDA